MSQLALIPPGSSLEEMAQVDPWVWVWLNELILLAVRTNIAVVHNHSLGIILPTRANTLPKMP